MKVFGAFILCKTNYHEVKSVVSYPFCNLSGCCALCEQNWLKILLSTYPFGPIDQISLVVQLVLRPLLALSCEENFHPLQASNQLAEKNHPFHIDTI